MSGFDIEAFRRARFTPREVELRLDALSAFGEVIKVRGLTAEDLARAEEASQKGKLVSDLIEKLAGSAGKEKASALLEGVGISSDVPAMLQKRMEHIVLGVVEPKLELVDVVKLGQTFPIEFNIIANKIIELTGQGQIADVKPRGSSKEPTSEQASLSAK